MREEFTFLAEWVRFMKAKVVVEVGVQRGDMAKFLCRAALLNGGIYHGYDLWGQHGLKAQFPQVGSLKQVSESLIPIVEETQLEGSIFLHQIDTVNNTEEFIKLLPHSIDFAFIDGDHSYHGVASDFKCVYPRLSDTGVIAFHDTLRIDGCREFVFDLRAKYDDGTYDLVDLPFAQGDRRSGVTLLVKRSFHKLLIGIDEVCGSLSAPADIERREETYFKGLEDPDSTANDKITPVHKLKLDNVGYYGNRQKFT